MAITKKTELIIEREFDPVRCRHTVNGRTSVLHCHHYISLYTQLAEDCGMLDARKLLKEVTEDTFYDVLSAYYKKHDLAGLGDRISIGEQYYAFCGLGQMNVLAAGPESGEVELIHSHADAGWIKKWGPREKPVNYVTCGYIAGLFAAAFDLAPRSFEAREMASIVAGAERSLFVVTR
jgi:hypothetical protein